MSDSFVTIVPALLQLHEGYWLSASRRTCAIAREARAYSGMTLYLPKLLIPYQGAQVIIEFL